MVLRLMPFQLAAYGLSDPGLVRQNNEDVWGCLPEQHLFILADGMGGHQAGEVAAREAVLYLCSYMRKLFDEDPENDLSVKAVSRMLREAIQDTNNFIYELGLTDEMLRGMGTTLLCLYFHNDTVVRAHVGDSRLYRMRRGVLEQMTQDHSLLRELIEVGKVKEKESTEFQYKNIITRAIGTEANVEPTISISKIEGGDVYLLCTDGLSDLLSQKEIESILKQPLTVEERVRSLISAAKRRGGYDNVTVVIIEVVESNANEDLS